MRKRNLHSPPLQNRNHVVWGYNFRLRTLYNIQYVCSNLTEPGILGVYIFPRELAHMHYLLGLLFSFRVGFKNHFSESDAFKKSEIVIKLGKFGPPSFFFYRTKFNYTHYMCFTRTCYCFGNMHESTHFVILK